MRLDMTLPNLSERLDQALQGDDAAISEHLSNAHEVWINKKFSAPYFTEPTIEQIQSARKRLDDVISQPTHPQRSSALFLRGVMREYGLGEADWKRSWVSAFEDYKLAIDMGNTHAMCRRAFLHALKDGEWGPQDYAAARDLYRRAGDMGDSNALCKLAKMLSLGLGEDDGEPNYADANVLLDRAIALNNPKAMCDRAWQHYNLGSQPNYAAAEELYQRAKSLNYAPAKEELARMYRHSCCSKITDIISKHTQKIIQFSKSDTQKKAAMELDKELRGGCVALSIMANASGHPFPKVLQEFKTKCTQCVNDSILAFKEDLDWRTNLINFLKEIANVFIGIAPSLRKAGFFKPIKESERQGMAKKLQEQIINIDIEERIVPVI